MTSRIARKLGIPADARAYLANAPSLLRDAIAGHLSLSKRLRGEFDYIHAFVTAQKNLAASLPRWREHLAPRGKLWISWPKNRQLESDLTLPRVIKIGYDHGLVESKTIGIDTIWSAIKFTHPRPGKQYRNSYGKLPGRTLQRQRSKTARNRHLPRRVRQ